MIIGIGIDIVNIERIKKSIEKYDNKFFNRIFTNNEIEYCKRYDKIAHAKFAMRFAAKEACLKAIGTGYSMGISFRDIEIVKNHASAPSITLHSNALTYIQNLYSNVKIFASLSDDGIFAIANVIIEGDLK